jgi:type II restriction enzyme
MTKRVSTDKWILRRHTSDTDLLILVAFFLKNLKSSFELEDRKELLTKLKHFKLYNERNHEIPTDKIDHVIKTLSFYMFGYIDKIEKRKTFLFSPLGNLFLRHRESSEATSKIFLTMLWGMQFPHPESGTDSKFKLFPFRLIFKLLNDERLNFKIYAFEFACIISFIETITKEAYESLVLELLNLRKLSNNEIKEIVDKDSHVYVNATYEWDYYTTKVLQQLGLITKINGEEICHLYHEGGNTKRKLTRNYIHFCTPLKSLYKALSDKYPFDATPILLNDHSRLKIDAVKEIFSFYPKELLVEISDFSETSQQEIELLELPKLIEMYSNNINEGDAYLFEEKLTDGFNLFFNVDAELIGGPGNTDIECLYTTNRTNKKFAVDAKSTKNKLTTISSGRLASHREKIGANYTIVITPRYVPAVKLDITNTNNVILLANTFSEYLYNCLNNNLREIDYKDFDEIIENNMGKDISNLVSNLTVKKFGHASSEN